MSKKLLTILYILLAVLAICGPDHVLHGYFLSPGGLNLGFLLGALSLVYLIIHMACAGLMRATQSMWRPRFWTRKTAVALLLVFWGCSNFVPGYSPFLFGYYLRAKIIGDVPAILAWADTYAASTSPPSADPADHRARNVIYEWEMVPYRDLPAAVKRMGGRSMVEFRRRDRALMVVNGNGDDGYWGLTVGHGIGKDAGGGLTVGKAIGKEPGAERWAVNQDAFVWAN